MKSTARRTPPATVTARQSERDAAVARHIDRCPDATYEDLARAAGCSKAAIRESLVRLGLPTSRTERAGLAAYAAGWDAAASL